MKLSKVTYAKHPGEGDWCLVLETIEDLKQYINIDNRNNVNSALALWNRLADYRGSKLQMDAFHAASGELGIARLMAYHLEYPKSENKETTIVDYCSQVDSILGGKYNNMATMIANGNKVRTNWKGGYSQFDDYFVSLEDRECPDDLLLKYLTTGEIEEKEMKFSKPILILENAEVCSPYTHSKLRQYQWEKYQIINHFRVRMANKTKEMIYKLFDDAIKTTLEAIYIETTLNDKTQFEGMKAILEEVMKNNPDKHLKIHLNITSGEDINIQTVPNISLNITNHLTLA